MLGTLMLFGPFRFSLDSTSYDELTRSSGWEWAEQPLIGAAPALQYVGQAAETMDLSGRLIPGFTGGPEQLVRMRALAGLGRPWFLIDGRGRVHGNWVIDRLTETGSLHFKDGMPRIITFTLGLKKYNDGTGVFGAITKASNIVSLFG